MMLGRRQVGCDFACPKHALIRNDNHFLQRRNVLELTLSLWKAKNIYMLAYDIILTPGK